MFSAARRAHDSEGSDSELDTAQAPSSAAEPLQYPRQREAELLVELHVGNHLRNYSSEEAGIAVGESPKTDRQPEPETTPAKEHAIEAGESPQKKQRKQPEFPSPPGWQTELCDVFGGQDASPGQAKEATLQDASGGQGVMASPRAEANESTSPAAEVPLQVASGSLGVIASQTADGAEPSEDDKWKLALAQAKEQPGTKGKKSAIITSSEKEKLASALLEICAAKKASRKQEDSLTAAEIIASQKLLAAEKAVEEANYELEKELQSAVDGIARAPKVQKNALAAPNSKKHRNSRSDLATLHRFV